MTDNLAWDVIRPGRLSRTGHKNPWCYTDEMKTVVVMKLTKGFYTTFDAVDLEKVQLHTWSTSGETKAGHVYAITAVPQKEKKQLPLRLHRLLKDTPADLVIDHINGDTMDNRQINMRIGTISDNNNNRRMSDMNTSGVNGVDLSMLNGNPAYRARWCNSEGKRKIKWFSFGRTSGKRQFITKEQAFEEAIAFRKARDAETGCTNGIRPKRQRVEEPQEEDDDTDAQEAVEEVQPAKKKTKTKK